MFRWLALAAAACLAACATQNTEEGFIGGARVKELGQEVYRISFSGNGYTSRETVQTYWLYRSAGFALEKGYTGFEILSDISFVMRRPAPEEDAAMPPGALTILDRSIPVSPIEITNTPAAASAPGTVDDGRVRVAHAVPIFIYSGDGGSKPWIEADVHFLRRPVESAPPKVFNARGLKAVLDPIVNAEKCNVGNICPHIHEYLLPKGKLR
jgi:hypothetical protein